MRLAHREPFPHDLRGAILATTSLGAIVYATDVKAAGSKAEGVDIPDSQNVVADYPIAIVKTTKHHDAAVAFVDAITKGSGQAALKASGFLTAA